MHSALLAIAAGFGFTGVAAGAFGAHALKSRLTVDALAVYQTGVLYHLVHAVALAVVAVLASRAQSSLVNAAGYSFVAGIVLFSGSLYLLAITGTRGLGAITPIGGLCFLAGWLCLMIAAIRS